MQGEFRVGMYAKITEKKHPHCGRVGLVKSIVEKDDFDLLTLEWSDGTTFNYKDIGENFDIQILLSRDYAVNWLTDERLADMSDAVSMSDDELLDEICLSGCVHDELIEGVFDDSNFKLKTNL